MIYTSMAQLRAYELVQRFLSYKARKVALFAKPVFPPYLHQYCTHRHDQVCVRKPLSIPFKRYLDAEDPCRGTGATALAGVVILVPLPVQALFPCTYPTIYHV